MSKVADKREHWTLDFQTLDLITPRKMPKFYTFAFLNLLKT